MLRGEGKVRADGTGRSATWTRMTSTTLLSPSEARPAALLLSVCYASHDPAINATRPAITTTTAFCCWRLAIHKGAATLHRCCTPIRGKTVTGMVISDAKSAQDRHAGRRECATNAGIPGIAGANDVEALL